jgi:hypothetical protein
MVGKAAKIVGAIVFVSVLIAAFAGQDGHRVRKVNSGRMTTAATDVQSGAVSVSFDGCLRIIREKASQFATAPVNIVETNALRMVRFCTSDGSVLVTCSAPDGKMVVPKSPHRSGCDHAARW